MSTTRRTFVLGGLAAAGLAAAPRRAGAIQYPFTLGVASGDPLPDSVILWTRLAPLPTEADGQGGMPNLDFTVQWQVATDESFATVVVDGSVTARYASAHSVHVDVRGLVADSEYFYRFRADGHLSPVGRTRTAPALGTSGRDLLMAFTSCAHYEEGYYTVYREMADDRPDLVLHLGDYIYESAPKATPFDPSRVHLGGELRYLKDYRRRYGQYKSDVDLQAAHAAAPWLVVPDDHEVENNYAGFHRADNNPVMTDDQFVTRRAEAYQAYYEHMPLRGPGPNGPNLQLYRQIRWGTLATFHLLDTRQFRNDQACGDGWKYCPDAGDPTRSLPGIPQENWLLDGLGQHYGTWDFIGQQVFFARDADENGAASMDAWDGYPASRDRIQKGWVRRAVRNPVVLTGDVHKAWANDLKVDYTNPNSPVIGTELVTSSVSSGGNGSGSTSIPRRSVNPHHRFFNDLRGYVRTRVGPTRLDVEFAAVPRVTTRNESAQTVKTFVVEEGHPGLTS
jgi:alkaline phosphatase D